MKFVGTIGKILDRGVNTRFGRKTFYSLKLDEHDQWISLGTKSPERFQEGDEVEVYAEQDARGYWNAAAIERAPEQPQAGREHAGVGERVAQESQGANTASGGVHPPAASLVQSAAAGSSSSSAAARAYGVSSGSVGPTQSSGGADPAEKAVGLGSGSYRGNTSGDRQTSIVLQHSQEMAIQAVSALLEHDGLPLTKASTKAGEAKRFSEIVAAIDKFTVKFYRDAQTGRLLETVADMGVVDTSADGPIPEPASTSTSEDDDL